MSPTAQQIAAMLARKQAIEAGDQAHRFGWSAASQRWLTDAVELLLRIELERQERP